MSCLAWALFFVVLYAHAAGAQTASGPEAIRGLGQTAFQSAMLQTDIAKESELALAAKQAENVYLLIADMDKQGMKFPDIFKTLCSRLRSGQDQPRLTLRGIFSGLRLWTKRAGKPVLLGSADRALHFIYGGWLSATFGQTIARTAGYEKERNDAFEAGNAFDLGELAVTYFGALWAYRMGKNPPELEPWALGTRRLDALPALSLGPLPPRILPTSGQLKTVDAWVLAAISPASP